jgi:protein involved in temperature-dependent protein secretion
VKVTPKNHIHAARIVTIRKANNAKSNKDVIYICIYTTWAQENGETILVIQHKMYVIKCGKIIFYLIFNGFLENKIRP